MRFCSRTPLQARWPLRLIPEPRPAASKLEYVPGSQPQDTYAPSEIVQGIRRRYDVVLLEKGKRRFVEIKAYSTLDSVSGKARMQFYKDLILRQRSAAQTEFIWVFPKNFMPGASKQAVKFHENGSTILCRDIGPDLDRLGVDLSGRLWVGDKLAFRGDVVYFP